MTQMITAESPADYGDVPGEYMALTSGVAVVDRSHVGRMRMSGADALDLLNRLSTNKLETLPEDQGVPTVLASPKGRVVDLLLVGARSAHFLCLTSPGRQGPVMEWIDFYTFAEDAPLEDLTPLTAQFALAGPGAASALSELGVSTAELPRYHLCEAAIGGRPVVVWHTLTSGTPTYEVIVSRELAGEVWRCLVEAGAVQTGQTAWEALRVAHGVPAYGTEYGDSTNPLESRLTGAISIDKGCYTGQEVIARLLTYKKVQRRLMAVSLSGQATPGGALLDGGQKVGVLTSVASVPSDDTYVALAMVSTAHAVAGKTLDVAGTGATGILSDPPYAQATEP